MSMETVISCVFLFSKAGKFKTNMARVPYNKLLTNLASSSRTGEYWPPAQPQAYIFQYGSHARLVRGYYSFIWKYHSSIIFVQTSLYSLCTAFSVCDLWLEFNNYLPKAKWIFTNVHKPKANNCSSIIIITSVIIEIPKQRSVKFYYNCR